MRRRSRRRGHLSTRRLRPSTGFRRGRSRTSGDAGTPSSRTHPHRRGGLRDISQGPSPVWHRR
eukprot:11215194-Alexandrium_andersonii.AAC.1